MRISLAFVIYVIINFNGRITRGDDENLALGRPTIQGSTYQDPVEPASHKAVDGSRDPMFFHGSCSHTELSDSLSWWMVDLMHTYTIHYILVYNRATHQDRLDRTDVDGFLYYPYKVIDPDNRTCAFHPGPSGAVVNVTCVQEITVRFIRLRRPGVLTLCEVEIYGHIAHEQDCVQPPKVEIQTGIQLNASSTGLGYVESRADCIVACMRISSCHVINHNINTGECRTAGFIKQEDLTASSEWTLCYLT